MQLPYLNGESVIEIFAGVPWDSTYKDFVRFASRDAQTKYFDNLTKKRFTEYSPVKDFPGVIAVGIKADEIYQYNYIRWSNGKRWWYGFITGIKYVNQGTSQITVQLDVMQSYWFDWDFGDCKIAREHVKDDTFGRNLQPEPISYNGEMVTGNAYVINPFEYNEAQNVIAVESSESLRPYIAAQEGAAWLEYTPGKIPSRALMYRATWITVFFVEGSASATALSAFAGLPGKLADALKQDVISAITILPLGIVSAPVSSDVSIPDQVSSRGIVDGYRPKNNKVYGAPFSFFRMFTPSQGAEDFDPARFYASDVSFNVIPYFNGSDSSVTFTPNAYSTYSNDKCQPFGGKTVTWGGFPSCQYITDTYRAFLAQRMYSNDNSLFAINTVSSAVGGAVSAVMTGNVGSALASAVGTGVSIGSSILQRQGQEALAYQAPDQVRGTSRCGSIYHMVNKNLPYIMRVSWPAYALKQADEYLTKYGYAVNRIGVPLTHSRKRWNYVELTDCVFKPGAKIPADASAAIKNVFTSGVTIWHDPAYIGDYTTDNTIS